MHGIGGGTGGGLGCLLISSLRDEHPAKSMASFAVVPSPEVSEDFTIEPLNAVLAMNQLIENSD